MRTLPLVGLLLTNLLLLLITFGLATPWTKVRLAQFQAKHSSLYSEKGLHEVVDAELTHQSSLGDEIGEAFDMDVNIGF